MAKKNKNEVLEKAKKQTESSKQKNTNGQQSATDYYKALDKGFLLKSLRYMVLARAIDTKAMNLLRQGKTFFHIAGAGHEAVQVAVGINLNSKKDWLFPYYRDLAVTLCAGVTSYEFFLQCYAKADDPSSGGRQLPCHWGSDGRINLPSQSSPTGTQFLNAVGAALASVKQKKDSITYVSSGEGTTSQG